MHPTIRTWAWQGREIPLPVWRHTQSHVQSPVGRGWLRETGKVWGTFPSWLALEKTRRKVALRSQILVVDVASMQYGYNVRRNRGRYVYTKVLPFMSSEVAWTRPPTREFIGSEYAGVELLIDQASLSCTLHLIASFRSPLCTRVLDLRLPRIAMVPTRDGLRLHPTPWSHTRIPTAFSPTISPSSSVSSRHPLSPRISTHLPAPSPSTSPLTLPVNRSLSQSLSFRLPRHGSPSTAGAWILHGSGRLHLQRSGAFPTTSATTVRLASRHRVPTPSPSRIASISSRCFALGKKHSRRWRGVSPRGGTCGRPRKTTCMESA